MGISGLLMRLILKNHKLDINAAENEKYDFVIKAAKGELTFDKIKSWIEEHLE